VSTALLSPFLTSLAHSEEEGERGKKKRGPLEKEFPRRMSSPHFFYHCRPSRKERRGKKKGKSIGGKVPHPSLLLSSGGKEEEWEEEK